MKWVRLGILVTLLCLPVFVLFTFDDMYNGLQDDICKQYPTLTTACAPYDARYHRTGLISTAFNRHIATYLDRKNPTAPAFIESVRQQTLPDGTPDPRIPKVEQKMAHFNRTFIAALNVSLALAGAALTIMIQKTARHITRRNREMSGLKKKSPAGIAQPTVITPTSPRATTPRTKPRIKKPATATKAAKTRRKPRAIPPGTHI